MKKGIILSGVFAPISAVGAVFPIDQFPVQDFNFNDAGFPRSDIDAFEQAQNDSVRQKILSRLEKIGKSTFDKRPTSEILETIIPNGCQSPAEIARYSSRLARHYQDKIASTQAVKAQQVERAKAVEMARKQQEDALFEKRFKESFIKMSESKK